VLPAPTDAELARRILSNDDRASAEVLLCERFGRRVRLYGLRHLGSEDAAAELVQQVLLRVLEKLRAGAVRSPERIASFILGTARMVSHEIRRGSSRAEPMTEEPMVAPVVTERALDRAALSAAMEELAERERAVLVATFFEGLSSKEIGAALSMSEGNVRVVRHRALGRLRNLLEGGPT